MTQTQTNGPLVDALADAVAELAAHVDMTQHPDVIYAMEWHRHHKGARYG